MGPYRSHNANPESASKYWMEQVYGPGRENITIAKTSRKTSKQKTGIARSNYFRTIRERLFASGSVAPFWSILNDGTPEYMDYDWGGTPHPTNVPTRFVERAQAIIQSGLDSYVAEETRKFLDLDLELKNVNSALEYLETIDFNRQAPREELLRLIEKQLGERFTRSDQNKLIQLVDDILSGEEVSRRRLGGNVQIRTTEIQNIINEYRRRIR